MVLGLNKVMNLNNLKFHFCFCLQYVLSHNPSVFDLSFLKLIRKCFLWAFTVQIIPVIFYNFKTKWLPFHYYQAILLFMQLAPYTLQCLSQCKRNLAHGNQHSRHPENGSKTARNSEARWKLLQNIKTDDSNFKIERNRIN